MSTYQIPSITDRDKEVVRSVRYLRMATSSQLRRLHFYTSTTEQSNKTIQQRRCKKLVDLGLISRLPRPIGGLWGSADYIYIPNDSKARQPNLHTLDVTELYIRLIEAQRSGVLQNLEYDGEPYCWVKLHQEVHLMPDARVRFKANDYKFDYFIELDRSSEWRNKLNAKMRRFTRAYNIWEGDIFPKVLFVVFEEERLRFIGDMFKNHEIPKLFEVCLFEDVIDKLSSM